MVEAERVQRMSYFPDQISMVLDTDTYNEVDDQFALAYAMLSPERLKVEAIYAAPYHNDRSSGPGDGMERSYDEIVRLLATLGHTADNFVYKGSKRWLPSADRPVESPAAQDLVDRAMMRAIDDPLYVVAIGAITNVASALLMEPAIAARIVVVWLGGHSLDWHTAREFNLQQDTHASRHILDSGVPLLHMPCYPVTSHLLTSLPELETLLAARNPLCDSLIELYKAYLPNHFARAKEIWDVGPIAWLVNPDWVQSILAPSPILTDGLTWSIDGRRHLIRSAIQLKRNAIFADMFVKLANAGVDE